MQGWFALQMNTVSSVAQCSAMQGWFALQKMNAISRVAVPQQKSLDLVPPGL